MSESVVVTPEASFVLRLRAYLGERFPILAHGVLVLCYFSSNSALASVLVYPGQPVEYGAASAMGVTVLFCFFLHLRVFDEHKDYAEDVEHHADRVLQRGLITLRHLKIIGAAAIGTELLLSAVRGPATVVSLLVALAFSLMMLKEFFARSWLKRHFLVYALSHMLVMPLLAGVVFGFSTERYFWTAPWPYWVFAAAGFLVGLGWEISRKIRAPEDEVEGVDTYTGKLGTHGATYVLLLVRATDVGLTAWVAHHLGLGSWLYGVLGASFALCAVGVAHFRARTCSATAKLLEAYASVHLLVSNLAFAAAIAASHGMSWGSQ